MFKATLFVILSVTGFSIKAASIIELANCNQALDANIIYTVLDTGRNTFDGWSHIEVGKLDGEYKALALDDEAYKITQNKYVADSSCDGRKVQNAVLVVKLSDWTRQHSNGFETILDTDTLNFANVTHVLLDIRVNREDSIVPSQDILKQRYKSYLTEEQFSEFDQGKVNLGLTLFEDGALDQSTESLNVEYFLEIDQDLYFDKWLRVLIPIEKFHTYTEENYVRTTKTLSHFSETRIKGIRITPENSHGKQLRNFLGDLWHEDIPETFKEMSLSLRRVELLAIK